MSVHIKGMKMPTERESFTITIKYNGVVLDTETGMQVAEAYELPPHGDLIDRNTLPWEKQSLMEADEGWALPCVLIEDAPTIIPAEEGEK